MKRRIYKLLVTVECTDALDQKPQPERDKLWCVKFKARRSKKTGRLYWKATSVKQSAGKCVDGACSIDATSLEIFVNAPNKDIAFTKASVLEVLHDGPMEII